MLLAWGYAWLHSLKADVAFVRATFAVCRVRLLLSHSSSGMPSPTPPLVPCLLSGLSTVSDRQRTLGLPRCAARTNYISISVFHLPLATCRMPQGTGHRVPQGGRSPGVHYASVFPARNGSKSARKMCSVAGTEITFINTYKASRGVGRVWGGGVRIQH